MIKQPLPGYGIAIIDKSQMDNVAFAGEDKWDNPQSGTLIKLSKQDEDRAFNEDGMTYGALLNKKVYWAKYAEADALFYEDELEKDIVFIALDKLRGYDIEA